MIIGGVTQTSFPSIQVSDVRLGVTIGGALGTLPANQGSPQGTGITNGRPSVVMSSGAVLAGASQ